MRLLAEFGADPRMSNEDGTTPLLVAAGVGTQAPGRIQELSRKCSTASKSRSISAPT
jgi:hypothetical protein